MQKVSRSYLMERFRERVLVLDGAMGTMLQRKGLCGNSEGFNLTAPEAILDIHRAYIAAGADIIESNTFSANRISQKEYGMEDLAREMALEGARLARLAADEWFIQEKGHNPGRTERRVLVAGSMGPTSKSLTLSSDLGRPDWRPQSRLRP